MSELRKDPILDEWVIVAESRSQRPGAFLGRPPHQDRAVKAGDSAADCPFCRGSEVLTPPAVHEELDVDGRWSVRIFPNKYPAVVPDGQPSRAQGNPAHGPANLGPAVGVHEVVVEAPNHATDFADLPLEQQARVVKAWRDRFRWHRHDGRWQAALLFKNTGREAGASVAHVHSQIVALPRVPARVQRELDAAADLHARHSGCAFCRFVIAERDAGERIVLDRDGFVAVAAYAGRQAYETWLLPLDHQAAYDDQSDASLARLAGVLGELLQGIVSILPVPAYNLVLHTAPFDTRWDHRYHWHIEIIPRISGLAGYELGAGEYINPVSPERAAREIKRNLTFSGKFS